MGRWSIEKARELYNIDHWSEGFFDIGEEGVLQAYPTGQRNCDPIDLVELTQEIEKAGLSLPVLVRFSDILKRRFDQLTNAFNRSIQTYDYQGKYIGVYPIKVNQQRRVVNQILQHGKKRVGLEAGSKPELMAVLGLSSNPTSVIVCNGYKDREYVRLALIGQAMGHRVYIILEKLSELSYVIEESKKMRLTPLVGIRIRLASMGNGKWQNTGGEKSKFGFSAAQVLQIIEMMRNKGCLAWLQLLHFHMGSQIANISDIQRGMRECARYYAELHELGVNIDTVDVGGGLAVDYEGTHSRNVCSKNYSIQEYANNIVYTLANICEERKLPHPNIITESGRAVTAHHAMLITNVIGVERTDNMLKNIPPAQPDESQVVQDLWHDLENISPRSALETYHDACYWMQEVHSMFTGFI